MSRTIFLSFVVVVVTMTGAWEAPAQNLVVNPDFDVDLSGWDALGVWDPMDVNGSQFSGSVTYTNTEPGMAGVVYMAQCVELTSFIEGFDLQGWVYVPSGQPVTGSGDITVWLFSDNACSVVLDQVGTNFVAVYDVWQFQTLTKWTPLGTASVGVGLANFKDGAGDYQTYHDAIFFGPNPIMIFGDDFESADFAGWSNAIGYPWFGAYDDCRSAPCNPGIDCVAIAGINHNPTCLPSCDPGSFCPGRERVAGTCALIAIPGPDPTHCGLLCDTATPICPAGMECFDLGGGGACLWPVP